MDQRKSPGPVATGVPGSNVGELRGDSTQANPRTVAEASRSRGRRPSFQFYPADWRANTKLRRCSDAERGIWLEVLCLMHDSDDYGVLRWPLKEIADAVPCRVQDLLRLQAKGVLKGADAGEMVEAFAFVPRHARRDGEPVVLIPAQPGPLWYSSRMVTDEYKRTVRANNRGDE